MPRNNARNRSVRNTRGFTLIELMVVVLIIGLVAATVVLSVGVTGRDNELEKESERVLALIKYAREKAELQTREFGLFCGESDYEFLTFDARKSIWRSVDEDEALRARELPAGLNLRLIVEGRPVVLKRAADKKKLTDAELEKAERERVPHIILYSNGDLTPFQLTVEREGGVRSVTMSSNDQGQIESEPLKEAGK